MPTIITQRNAVAAIPAGVSILPLCNFSAQTLIFGSAADDTTTNQCKYLSSGIDMIVDAAAETDTVNFTMFVVSLKDQATQAFNPTTGLLTLTAGVHYSSLEGMAMVNKTYFNVHKVKRFATGNHGAASYVSSALDDSKLRMRTYFKIKPNMTVKNPTGDWKALVCPRDPSQNWYILFFNNDTDADAPTLTMNQVSTYKSF